MNKKHLSDFTNLFPVSKTLRFRLEPQGKTMENIVKAQTIETDEERSHDYEKTKEYIDDYHRQFIDDTLDKFAFKVESTGNNDSLQDYLDAYLSANDNRTKQTEEIQTNLRKAIVSAFKMQPQFNLLFKKEMVKHLLPQFVDTDDKKRIVAKFNDFTTYFTGFFTNRENMYSDEAKSTSIAYRIVNQNLIKFVENMLTFKSHILPILPQEQLATLYDDFKEYLNVASIAEMFELDHFSIVLTQRQIEVYNSVIGGRKDENNKQIKPGLNQYINQHNQAVKDKSARLPLLKPLFNQILSEKAGVSFLPKQFKSASEVVKSLNEAYAELSPVLAAIQDVVTNITDYDCNGIFIKNDLGLTDIAQRFYGNYDAVKRGLRNQYELETPMHNGQKAEKYEEQVAKHLKSIESVSLAQINQVVTDGGDICDYFKAFGATDDGDIQRENLLASINNAHTAISPVLNKENANDNELRKNTMLIKDLLDAIKRLQWFAKPLLGAGDETNKDQVFYGKFEPLYNQLDETISPLYDKVRSYLTKKPYSLDKFKINFEKSNLLGGWDPGADRKYQYNAVILRKDNDFYLGIMRDEATSKRKCIQVLDCNDEGLDENFEKVEYKQIKPSQNMPRCAFAKKECEENADIMELKRKKNAKSYNTNKDDKNALIRHYQRYLDRTYPEFGFVYKDADEYDTVKAFTDSMDSQDYKLSFLQVSETGLNKLVDEGDLYLFKITNKDFSSYAKGRPNLHTIYWRMLFDPKNLANVVYKLEGKAEVFFRRKSLASTTTHKAKQAIKNKSRYNEAVKPQSTFDYDIIKDRRFTADKFEFHVPIKMNFKAAGWNSTRLTNEVREFIKSQGVRHIIGIDRGERHLLYLTMIDMDGNIVKQCSLNAPAQDNARASEVDYHQLLDSKEADRLAARRNWGTIENIKELKQGYLSQVVHLLATMMVDNDAILVLENLNAGFMRGRQKVEKSVYQKFEKMLIDKLNYIVDKGQSPDKPTGALHAVQLTGLYSDFNKSNMKRANVRQCGFVFYIPAWNTSKIDPVTGFVNLFDTHLSSMGEIKAFFSKFDSIRYNQDKGWFEFKFDYSRFTTRAEGCRTQWTVCTYGERIWTHRSKNQNNQFVNDTVNVTQQMLQLLQDCGIDPNGNLKEAIANIDSKKSLETLLHLFKLTVQMRNSVTGSEVDYMISPVADERGHFFDSRESDEHLPANADANGAFNIARKGLMVVRQIMATDDVSKIKFAVSNKDWLRFAQHIDD